MSDEIPHGRVHITTSERVLRLHDLANDYSYRGYHVMPVLVGARDTILKSNTWQRF